jgi:nucleotide-binding universal stress UspA family protein
MTVLAGYAPWHASTGVLELATAIATARGEDLLVAAVVPPRWNIPSPARQADGEVAAWASEQGEAALAAARTEIHALPTHPTLEVTFRWTPDRSAASGLKTLAGELGASVIVVGSAADGRAGRVALGSTSDRLVHSSRVPVAVAPRDYRGVADGFGRLTCGVTGRRAERSLLGAAVALAASAQVPLRLATFVVRIGTMYPPEVGLRAEDEVAAQARDQAQAALTRIRDELATDTGTGGSEVPVTTVVGVGQGWHASLGSVPWQADELLVVGSKPAGTLAHVFLGSSATKIVRHAPVPVLILPG